MCVYCLQSPYLQQITDSKQTRKADKDLTSKATTTMDGLIL